VLAYINGIQNALLRLLTGKYSISHRGHFHRASGVDVRWKSFPTMEILTRLKFIVYSDTLIVNAKFGLAIRESNSDEIV